MAAATDKRRFTGYETPLSRGVLGHRGLLLVTGAATWQASHAGAQQQRRSHAYQCVTRLPASRVP